MALEISEATSKVEKATWQILKMGSNVASWSQIQVGMDKKKHAIFAMKPFKLGGVTFFKLPKATYSWRHLPSQISKNYKVRPATRAFFFRAKKRLFISVLDQILVIFGDQ